MIKSLLIKLRQKPKIVREHVALTGAGIITVFVFTAWAFTLPEKFSGTKNTQTAGMFSTLKDEISGERPDLGEIAEEFKEVIATSSDEIFDESEEPVFTEQTIEINYPIEEPKNNSRSIRIATTSTASSS